MSAMAAGRLCLQAANMTFAEGGTITLVYPEGCAATMRGEFGTNAQSCRQHGRGYPAQGQASTSLGAIGSAVLPLYTVQG